MLLPCPSGTGTSPDDAWTVYSHIDRLDTGPLPQLDRFGALHMTHQWLLHLWMALECDAWVSTRGSNWNRLIDELRCVLVGKCRAGPFLEVNVPHSWASYNW